MSLKLTLKEYLDAMHKVASIYFNNLKSNKQALDYLYSRGLTDEEIDKYYIGYADADPYSLSTLLDQDFKQEHFETLGMFINQEGRFIDRFAGRIIFPVCDVQGNIVSFCGRGFEGGIVLSVVFASLIPSCRLFLESVKNKMQKKAFFLLFNPVVLSRLIVLIMKDNKESK